MGNARSEKKALKGAATVTYRDRVTQAATPKMTEIMPRVHLQAKNRASADRAEVEVVLEGKAHALILATNNRIGRPRTVLIHHRPQLRRNRVRPAPKVDRGVRSLFFTQRYLRTSEIGPQILRERYVETYQLAPVSLAGSSQIS